jgi:hypothetical protein
MGSLIGLAETPWPGAGHGGSGFKGVEGINRVFLTLYILPGVSPDRLVCRCIEGNKAQNRVDGRCLNTLIGLVKA